VITHPRVARHHQRYEFDSRTAPVLRVPSGSTITFETLDCFSNRITSPDQRFAREEELLAILGAYNPVAGPVYVEGAEPGDVLAVRIDAIALGTAAPYAVTVTFGDGSRLVSADCPGIPPDGDTKVCAIREGAVMFPTGRGELQLPLRPMVGTIGTAPAEDPVPTLYYTASHGGNIDCPLATTGSVLYLPVNAPGALLSLGDVHAVMGDGEITGTALETSADVTVTVTVLPGDTGRCTLPSLDNDTMIGVLGCHSGAGLDQNIQAAMLGTHRRLIAEYGLAPADAYQLLGASARILVNQCVEPPTWSTVHVGVPRPMFGPTNCSGGRSEARSRPA
jgi:amidase